MILEWRWNRCNGTGANRNSKPIGRFLQTSYQVLEEWAALGLGAAILPKLKLQSSERQTYVLTNHKGKELTLDFEAVWLNTPQRPVHFQQFTDFLAGYREDL